MQIGSDPKVVSEFYQPLNATRTWFIAPSVRIEARDLQIYSNDVEVADYRDREAEADFDVGRKLGNWGEIRVGYHRTNGAATVRLGDPALVESQYNNGELFFKFSYDDSTIVHFPREGSKLQPAMGCQSHRLGRRFRAYDKVQADWLMARSRGRNTLLLWASAGSVVDGNIKPTACRISFPWADFSICRDLAPQFAVRPELCHRPRHLFSQDQPRRRGILRISRLRRHVVGNRQHLADTAAT